MTTEDLQAKYRDKQKELKPSVPLAADSAHLLTEYLDSISVEFVKQGVMEPYRITHEFEEILVGELQQQGSKNKLTYDVTSKVLEKYGSPQQVVVKYIKENKPSLHPILVSPSTDEVSRPTLHKPTTTQDYVLEFTVWLVLLYTLVFEIVILLFVVMLDLRWDNYVIETILLVPFVLLEIVSGWKGTKIEKKYYHTIRETIRFMVSSYTLIGIMWFVNIRRFSWIIPTLLPVGLVYGIGLLKDHTDIFMTTTPKEKPIARFILPSYIFLSLSYLLSLVVLNSNNIGHDFYTEFYIKRINPGWIIFVIILVVFALLMDYERKYPFSFKKLGYSFMFYFFIYFAYSYRVGYQYNYNYVVMTDVNSMFNLIIVFTLMLAIVVPMLFREEIKTQLEAYRQTLNDYRI